MVEEKRNKDYPMGTTPRGHRQTRHNNALAGLPNQRRLIRALAYGHRLAYIANSPNQLAVESGQLRRPKYY